MTCILCSFALKAHYRNALVCGYCDTCRGFMHAKQGNLAGE